MDFYNSTVRDWIKHLPRGFAIYVADDAGWRYDVTDENIDYIPGMDLVPDRIDFDINLRTVMFYVTDVKGPDDV
jgi:hypothetical protein